MPALIVLVDADRRVLRRTEDLLSEAGHLVAAVSTFPQARHLLDTVNPDLLVAAVQLGAFNGLHLVVRSRRDHPDLPVIVTHVSLDPVLERDASGLGAAFVVDAPENPEFLRTVQSALESSRLTKQPIRRWSRKQASSAIEARLATSAARVLDISYGGLRLAFHEPQELPPVFDVTLPTTGLKVSVRRVWTGQSRSNNEFLCGGEIDAVTRTQSLWCEVVDAVN